MLWVGRSPVVLVIVYKGVSIRSFLCVSRGCVEPC